MRVLVTGGAGYIGSHTLVELLAAGHEVCVVDNHANSSPEALLRVRDIAGRGFESHVLDLRDTGRLTAVAQAFRPEVVIHFAGLKAVGEGEEQPLSYYEVNVGGTLSLLRAMEAADCGRIIFSSSATVYGMPRYLPYDEDHPLAPVSVYGRTKMMAEDVLRDWAAARRHAGQPAAAILLRYFNPVGAHESGRIGEDPRGEPQNLMPYLAQVATGRRAALRIFGDDWPTSDGTGVRDYIHVVDLARAHVAALTRAAVIEGGNEGVGKGSPAAVSGGASAAAPDALPAGGSVGMPAAKPGSAAGGAASAALDGVPATASGVPRAACPVGASAATSAGATTTAAAATLANVSAVPPGETPGPAEAYNIGTGQGVSVREMLAAFSRVVGRELPFEIAPRRPGDLAESRAACARAAEALGWQPEHGLDDMVESLWRWQSQNPDGYGG